ncbi:MAG: hypothetical protein KBG84_00680 [Planctomycetes bacterium]|nr:hypothetical protein [Planctomycetota bacterium]
MGDTRFPVTGEPTKEAIAEATGVPLKNLAIVSVDDETCQAQASERVCSCDPGIWVDVGMSWQSTPATDLGKMVEEAKELRTARMAERHGGTTIVSFGDLYDVNNPKTYRGWHELAHKPEGEALPGVAMHRGGHKDFVYRQADANAARDWWLFRAVPSGKPIWYGFASAFAVIMRFSPLACKAISNLNGGVPNNPSDARVRPGVPSIYAQWVKPWSIGAFGFDRTSSYDNLTVGAVDAGQIIREGAMQSQRRCLVFCDSPGLHNSERHTVYSGC